MTWDDMYPRRFLAPNKYGDMIEYRLIKETAHYVTGQEVFTGKEIKRRKSSVIFK